MGNLSANSKNPLPSSLPLPSINKTILWLPDSNKYLLVSPPADKLTEKIYCGESDQSILDYCTKDLGITPDEANETIDIIKSNLAEIEKEKEILPDTKSEEIPPHRGPFPYQRFYKTNGLIFDFEYESQEIESLVHPKFAHLEMEAASKSDHHFQLYTTGSKTALRVNGNPIGAWSVDKEHFMTGKVSMEMLQKIHQNEESDWMAVFHAAAVSNQKESIIFFGESGNGKSTLAAILMASGYEVLADDFLPVESNTSRICSFPAAISVKKNALDMLAIDFPELNQANEYAFPKHQKKVRYLSNPDAAIESPKKLPCKALIFVHYDSDITLQCSPLSKDQAFQRLVPDSWISPLEKNALQFLQWFSEMPCYQLIYSDNVAMVKTVQNLFDDAL